MYIVTGGAGFIGSALLAKLNASGIDKILVVDNLGSSEKWKNLSNKRIDDYLHKDQLLSLIARNALPTIHGIIHLGACSSTTETNAEYMMQNNYRYSKELAGWALSKNIRFIYASSAATYGDGEQGFSDQESGIENLRPLNVYALSKQLFDIWALQSKALNRCAGLKFFNVYGPNEYHKADMRSVVQKAYEQIRDTGEVKLFKSYRKNYADGEQNRDFIYVKDCTDVLAWLLERPDVNGLFNLGTGRARSWNDLANAVFSAMGVTPNIKYTDMPQELQNKYQYTTEARMEKLKATGCPVTFRSLEAGVEDYVKNYLSAPYPYL